VRDENKIAANLMRWAEITELCLALRKAVLKRQFPHLPPAEIEKRLWQEIRKQKERAWKKQAS